MNKESRSIVYFDGVCGFCNKSVDFLIRKDKRNTLLFTPIQGETARQNLPQELREKVDTVIFQNPKGVFVKSTAFIEILRTMGGFWKVAVIQYIIPRFIRDWVYNGIAANRYRWFGKKDSCRMPSPEERMKFLP